MNRTSVAVLVGAGLLCCAVTQMAAQTEEERRFKLAQGYEQSGDLKNAARVYKELYDLDPQSNAYFEGVRRAYMGLLLYGELLPMAERHLRSHEGDIALRSFVGQLLHRVGRRDEAEQAWRKAAELRPDDPLTYMYIAQTQTELRLFDRAIETYKDGRSRIGGRETFADQLAQLYGIIGRYKEASEEYLALLSENQARMNFVMSGLGVFTANPEGAAAAIEVTRRYSERAKNPLPYLDLLSWLYTEQNDYDGAFEIAKRIDQLREAGGSNIYGFADRAYRTEKYDVAIGAFEYFLETYSTTSPLYPSVVYYYTRALEENYRLRGEPSESEANKLIDRYREFITQQKDSPIAAEALLHIAQLQADDLNEPEDALKTLDELRKTPARFASLPEAMLLEGDLQLRVGNVESAQEFYRSGMTHELQSPERDHYRDLSALRYAETLFFTGRFKESVDAFTELTRNTASEAANDALEYLFILQDNFEKNDQALSRYAAGALALRQHRWEGAIGEMEKIAAMTKNNLSDDALLGKAEAQRALGLSTEAVATFMRIVTDHADGTLADRALFRAAEITDHKLGDAARAIELYSRILTEYPNSTYVAVSRQRIRALRGDS